MAATTHANHNVRVTRIRHVLSVLLALLCVAVPAWVAATRWSTLITGHPAYPVLLGVLALAGVAVGIRAGRAGTTPTGRRSPWHGLRLIGRVAATIGIVGVAAIAAWLRPYPADPVAVAAAAASDSVDVAGGATAWELRPRGGAVEGVVFFPGALVDPRAYLALLRPLAEQGALVVVVKPPLNLALLAPDVGGVLDRHLEVQNWVVGGHSLGGVPAASAAARADGDARVRGLFFWASYPAQDVSAAPVATASVSGDLDGLATPSDIAASRALLPSDTAFTVVRGGVHAFFGDYGPQSGDGEPGTTRANAQRQIVDATAALLARVG